MMTDIARITMRTGKIALTIPPVSIHQHRQENLSPLYIHYNPTWGCLLSCLLQVLGRVLLSQPHTFVL